MKDDEFYEDTEMEKIMKTLGKNPSRQYQDPSSILMENLEKMSAGQIFTSEDETYLEDEDFGARSIKDIANQSHNRNKNIKTSGGRDLEEALSILFELHDDLIYMFENTKPSSKAKPLIFLLEKTVACIRALGAEVEDFDPLMHSSGLSSPNLSKAMQRVIENTQECYRYGGNVELISINGSTIEIFFTGKTHGQCYVVHGLIESENWAGNEAIDYVPSDDGGKLSVKAFEGGKWVNKSDLHDIYDISYDLYTTDDVTKIPSIIQSVKDSQEENNIELEEPPLPVEENLIEEDNMPESVEKLKDDIKSILDEDLYEDLDEDLDLDTDLDEDLDGDLDEDLDEDEHVNTDYEIIRSESKSQMRSHMGRNH